MKNVLVVDPTDSCANLLRSILIGKDYGVSLVSRYKDAMRRIETGLFDVVFLTIEKDQKEDRFVHEALKLIPPLPIIAVSDEGVGLASDPSKQSDFFSHIRRPINIRKVISVVDSAIKELLSNIEDRREYVRKTIDMLVRVSWKKKSLTCKATNLSLGGVQVEPQERASKQLKEFFKFFELKGIEKKPGRVYFEKEKELKLKYNIAYKDFSPSGKLRHVGLSFADVKEKVKEILMKKLLKVA